MTDDDKPSTTKKTKPVTASQAITARPTPKKQATRQAKTNPVFNILLSLAVGFLGGWAAIQVNNDSQDAATIVRSDGERVILQESELIADIAQDVGQSVVSIDVESSQRSFFGNSFSAASAGTGIILSEDGYVLTNRHVIPENTTSVTVVLADGTKYEDVEVVGRDPFTDIAFMKIKDASGLKAATLGNSSEVKVGERVVAIGNALGEFSNTVTSGIISGLSRPIVAGDGFSSGESLQNLFQTDASINQGNSGGPLVNASGQVIGVNTAVAGGGAENIGFAIPIDDIAGTIQTVLERGELIKPYLGVRYINLTPDIAAELDLPVNQGAYLDDSPDAGLAVLQDSPADKAGLRGGDIITKVGDQEITDSIALSTLVGRFKVGETLTLSVLRDGEEVSLEVTLERAPEDIGG